MKIINKLKYGILGACTLALFACGGGGNGGGDGGGDSATVYSGQTGLATIDQSNAKDFSDSTYSGSGATDALPELGAVKSNNGGANLQGFAKTFRTFIKDFDVSKDSAGTAGSAALENLSDKYPGACGGSIAFNINFDSASGAFNGSLTFNAYNDCDGTVNGSVTYSGALNVGTAAVTEFTMTFSSLSFSDDTESLTMNGSASFSQISLTVSKVVLNMDYKDNKANITYRTVDLAVTTTDHGASTSETITGRVYHPDYGYVDVKTESLSPIVVIKGQNYPSSGVVVLTGANSKATITFETDSYTIQVDEGADGSIEQTKTCTWEPDTCTP